MANVAHLCSVVQAGIALLSGWATTVFSLWKTPTIIGTSLARR